MYKKYKAPIGGMTVTIETEMIPQSVLDEIEQVNREIEQLQNMQQLSEYMRLVAISELMDKEKALKSVFKNLIDNM